MRGTCAVSAVTLDATSKNPSGSICAWLLCMCWYLYVYITSWARGQAGEEGGLMCKLAHRWLLCAQAASCMYFGHGSCHPPWFLQHLQVPRQI
ncbi:hypothetical protein COO60DRAFT_1629808, partial [Scenedesmus sp. NREL 46B-D3]